MTSLFDSKTYRRTLLRWILVLASGLTFVIALMKLSVTFPLAKDPILVLFANFIFTAWLSSWVQKKIPPKTGSHPRSIRAIYGCMESALFGCYLPALLVIQILKPST